MGKLAPPSDQRKPLFYPVRLHNDVTQRAR